jgi:hypothetical protein
LIEFRAVKTFLFFFFTDTLIATTQMTERASANGQLLDNNVPLSDDDAMVIESSDSPRACNDNAFTGQPSSPTSLNVSNTNSQHQFNNDDAPSLKLEVSNSQNCSSQQPMVSGAILIEPQLDNTILYKAQPPPAAACTIPFEPVITHPTIVAIRQHWLYDYCVTAFALFVAVTLLPTRYYTSDWYLLLYLTPFVLILLCELTKSSKGIVFNRISL